LPRAILAAKLGSRNRATVIASGLLEGDVEALVRKAIELAKAGDVVMLKFLLCRVLPRDRDSQIRSATNGFCRRGRGGA
jgi:hypothetical protein